MDGLLRSSRDEAHRPSDVSQRGVEVIPECDLVADTLALCQGFDGIHVTLRDCSGDTYNGQNLISSLNWYSYLVILFLSECAVESRIACQLTFVSVCRCRIKSLGKVGHSVALIRGYLQDVSGVVSSQGQGDPNTRLRQVE